MTDSEITITILKDIRDAVRGTNDRIDVLDKNVSTRIDGLWSRIDGLDRNLSTRFDVVEHTVRDLAAQLLLIGRYLKNRTEVTIEELRERIARLEAKVG